MMKRFVLIISIVLVLISTALSYSPVVQTSPEDTVRHFYTWYMHRLNLNDTSPLKNRTEALKYLTPEYLRRVPKLIKEQDADVIICGQDFDKAWEKNVKVDEAKVTGDHATTMAHLTGPEMSSNMKVGLKHITAGWRIDSVDCAN